MRTHQDGVAYFDDRDAPMVILRGAVKPVAWQPTGVFLSFAGEEVSKKSPGNPYLNLIKS